jgi:hypothetical protein
LLCMSNVETAAPCFKCNCVSIHYCYSQPKTSVQYVVSSVLTF